MKIGKYELAAYPYGEADGDTETISINFESDDDEIIDTICHETLHTLIIEKPEHHSEEDDGRPSDYVKFYQHVEALRDMSNIVSRVIINKLINLGYLKIIKNLPPL